MTLDGNGVAQPAGGGGSGTSDTTETTQLLVKTAVQDLDTAMGTVTASPTANTLLDRVKALLTGTILAAGSAIIGKVSIDQVTSGANIVVSTTQSSTNVSVSAYATNLVISATSKRLFGMSGYNSNVAGQFIQLHDASTLPADTVVPVVIFFVPGLSNFSIDFGVRGRNFTTGIVVCNSSTGPTKTIGAADCFFDAQVL
jgi:hypothetical protein